MSKEAPTTDGQRQGARGDVRQLAHPTADDLADALGQAGLAAHEVVAPVRRRVVGPLQMTDDLADEERVAAGLAVQGSDDRGGVGAETLSGHRVHEGADLRLVEARGAASAPPSARGAGRPAPR